MSNQGYFVVVDDTDPRINYNGPWTSEPVGKWDEREVLRVYGPTWNRTLHSAREEASFSFHFNGTSVAIFMSYEYDTTPQHPVPSWICKVDDVAIKTNLPKPGTRNFHRACGQGNLPAGKEHILTFHVTFPVGGEFLLDLIHFAPEVEPTEGEYLRYQDRNSHLVYSPPDNWKAGEYGSTSTTIPGSTMTMKFTGVAFRAWGQITSNLSNTATYSIDNSPPTEFPLRSFKTEPIGGALLHQELFSVYDLPPTDHQVVITFTGDEERSPLSLDFVHVQLPPSSSSNPTSPQPSTSVPTSPLQSANFPIGVTVGCTMGSLGALSVLILVTWCCWKTRRDQDLEAAASAATIHPFPLARPNLRLAFGRKTSTPSPRPPQPAAGQSQERTPELRLHTDSGLRLNLPTIVDIPPKYTEG